MSTQQQGGLADELQTLAAVLEKLDLVSGPSHVADLGTRRDRLARSIRSYLLPRLSGEPGPLLVVVAGPTGSGKSTLVNSLSGLEVSETGPLRPTTTGPVVLVAGRHVADLGRISGVDCAVIGGSAPILSKIALVDTPDLDSTSIDNRTRAEILIDNADIVVFVTSALRYADLVPWEVLRRAVSRGAPVIPVINRLGAGSGGAVTDFRSRLGIEGLDANVVRVPEHHISAGGHLLPGRAVRELQRRVLATAAALEDNRREVVDRVMRSTTTQILQLADELDSFIARAEGDRAKIELALEDEARVIDLTDLCEGLGAPGAPQGKLAGLVWPWRNRVGVERWVAITTVIEQRLVAMVETDIRHAVFMQDLPIRLTREVVEYLRTETSSAARAWLGQLDSLAASARRGGGQLGCLVLADAAARGERTPACDLLFDDGSLVARAHRRLVSRLEKVYEQLWARSISQVDTLTISRVDTDRLREVASTVTARSHFADA